MIKRLFSVAILLCLPLLASCEEDDEPTAPEPERFVAFLSGPNTTATGTASFEVQQDGSINYTLDVQNISAVTAAHIHGPAAQGANAGVLVSLFPTTGVTVPTGAVSGRLGQGSFNASGITASANMNMNQLLILMRTGGGYVNVHTTAAPAGLIRGTVGPAR